MENRECIDFSDLKVGSVFTHIESPTLHLKIKDVRSSIDITIANALDMETYEAWYFSDNAPVHDLGKFTK